MPSPFSAHISSDDAGLEAAAATVIAARWAGDSIQRIADRTGLDPVAVRNILAVTPAQAPHARPRRSR